MAADKWQVPVQPERVLRRDVRAFKDGTEIGFKELFKKINDLQEQVNELTAAINELVSMIKEEVKEVKEIPLRKRELPPPPRPTRTLELPPTY